MESASFQRIASQFTESETPRVWSLLVTTFGELAQTPDAQISGALLRAICELIGVKPEAMRVALHRLRKDGWIESRRSGRTSSYGLTDWGRTQSAQASPRIYAKDALADRSWLILTNPAENQADERPAHGTWITPNLMISASVPRLSDAFVTPIDASSPLPDWIKVKVCAPETLAMSRNLAGTLKTVQTLLSNSPDLDPLEIAVLRILLVHSWRRIVLKIPALPDNLFPQGWRGTECREMVFDILSALPKRGLAELEDSVAAVV